MIISESLKLLGPNRRSEHTVIEVWIEFTVDESVAVAAAISEIRARAELKLKALGATGPDLALLGVTLRGEPVERFGGLVAAVALVLQRLAGHRVGFHASYPGPGDREACFAVEYEHGDDGLEAVTLAFGLLEILSPGVFSHSTSHSPDFDTAFSSFRDAAKLNLLPRDTEDIIEAAGRMDIPCSKLERDPYQGVSGDFRIRPNGLLKLGYGRRQRIVDGTLPIDGDEHLGALAHNRAAVRQALQSFGANVPPGQFCVTSRQAAKAADAIGYPVIIKPGHFNRSRQFGRPSSAIGDRASLIDAARACLQASPGILIERFVEGRVWRALLAQGELVALLAIKPEAAKSNDADMLHPTSRQWLEAMARKLGSPLLSVTLALDNLTMPLDEAGAIINFNVAPELDRCIPRSAEISPEVIRRRMADGLVRHLFPDDRSARIPILAVTGTNGKSTVCAMAARIMQHAGYSVGRAGTTGLYLNDSLLESGDFSGGKGHHRILESPDVDLAVLETARGAATGYGLMYDASDVSVCTNVSKDHLGERGIETVDQMAELKRFIVDRARHAVVLNADNPYSAAMLPHLPGRRPWLVSEKRGVTDLSEEYGRELSYCTAEGIDGEEWLVLCENNRTHRVIRVEDIPATLRGTARFNVSNALQAIAACHQMGASIEQIGQALSGFTSDYRDNPARMNFFEEHPFRVIFDFAHNPESYRVLRSVVDRIESDGRKILIYSRRGNVAEEEFSEIGGILSDGFDLFIVRDHPKRMGREPGEIPLLLKRGLLHHGVAEDCVLVSTDEDAVAMALNLARRGDLLVVTTTTAGMDREWAQITGFGFSDKHEPD